MTRLPGWPYAGDDPDGFLPPATSSSHLERYAASFDAPVVDRHDGAPSSRRAAAGYRDPHATRAPGARGTSSSPPAPTAYPTCPAGLDAAPTCVTAEPLPQPRPAARRRRAGRGRLGVRACRSPTSWPGPAATSSWPSAGTPGCRGATGAWTSSGGSSDRAAGAHHRRGAATRRPRARAVAAAGRAARADEAAARTSTSPPCSARGVRLAGRLGAGRGGIAALRRRPGRATADGGPRMHRFLDTVDRYVDRAGLTREVLAASAPRSPSRVADPAPARPARRGDRHRRPRRPATAPHHPWLRAADHRRRRQIRQYRGVTDAPGVYVVGQRFQHRRDSAFIDGARHDAPPSCSHLIAARAERGRARTRGSAS